MKNNVDATRIAGTLTLRFDRASAERVAATINRFAAWSVPKGVRLEALADGVRLSGRGLRRRMIDDAQLRNFGR